VLDVIEGLPVFLKRRALPQKRRVGSCWQEIRHVCGLDYRL